MPGVEDILLPEYLDLKGDDPHRILLKYEMDLIKPNPVNSTSRHNNIGTNQPSLATSGTISNPRVLNSLRDTNIPSRDTNTIPREISSPPCIINSSPQDNISPPPGDTNYNSDTIIPILSEPTAIENTNLENILEISSPSFSSISCSSPMDSNIPNKLIHSDCSEFEEEITRRSNESDHSSTNVETIIMTKKEKKKENKKNKKKNKTLTQEGTEVTNIDNNTDKIDQDSKTKETEVVTNKICDIVKESQDSDLTSSEFITVRRSQRGKGKYNKTSSTLNISESTPTIPKVFIHIEE